MVHETTISTDTYDVIVLGAGPAGALAALRAAELGARTALVTTAEFGGMAANDGPVPVRTLAFAARLIRDARELSRYGISTNAPELQYDRLLARVREVAHEVSTHSALRARIDALGVSVYERSGAARFTGPHSVETAGGLCLKAEKFILCTGGVSRQPAIPGIELTHTHSHAWKLTQVPASGTRACRLPPRSRLSVRRFSCSSGARASCAGRTRRSRPPSPPGFASRAWQCANASAPSRRSSGRRPECA
jgi:pyruvate/2-oxoglutarate dehydrogenase complex dihydrolipoamide dehydrogenase (E3) component